MTRGTFSGLFLSKVLFIILGLVLTTAIGLAFIFNSNNARKIEAARLKELARQEVIKAQAEAEKAKQERLKAEQERQKAALAQKEVQRARQLAMQAQKEAEQARIIAKETEEALKRREVKTTQNTEFPSGEFGDRDWLVSLWYANNTYQYRGRKRATGDSSNC